MEFDLFTLIFLMGARFALVLGVMLFILSLGRDAWSALMSHEYNHDTNHNGTDSLEQLAQAIHDQAHGL